MSLPIFRRALFGATFAASLAGCAELRPMLAPPGDLEDYRAFRVAAAEGTRLARAKRYLERHPNGVWAAEVKAVFDEEEPRYFEESQASHEGVRRYLADLPDGPHAQAAAAMLVAFGSSMQDAELRDIARKARSDDVRLEAAAVQRRAVGEGILNAVGVLLDEDNYGKPLSDAPPKLQALLVGRNAATWGGVRPRREDDFFFVLPTRPERESRLLTLEVSVTDDGGAVSGGTVEGSDLLVRWAEADRIVRLDSSSPEDRTEAQVHAMARLEGALERRFPSASCPDLRKDRELYHRACYGWEGVVLPGLKAGDKDSVIIRAPRASVANPRKPEASGSGQPQSPLTPPR